MALGYSAFAAEECSGTTASLVAKNLVADRLYILMIGVRDNAAITLTSVTDDGVSTGPWTVFETSPETDEGGTKRRCYAAWMIAGATESGVVISVSFDAFIGEGNAQVLEIDGHDAATPIRQSGSVGQEGGSGTTLAITLGSTPLSGSHLFGFLFNEGNGPINPGADYTEITELSQDTNDFFQSQVWTSPTDGVVDWAQIDDQDTPAIAFEVAEAPVVADDAGVTGALLGSF